MLLRRNKFTSWLRYSSEFYEYNLDLPSAGMVPQVLTQSQILRLMPSKSNKLYMVKLISYQILTNKVLPQESPYVTKIS